MAAIFRRENSLRVLVTGGAGYIGSVVAARLVEVGNEVVVYDNLRKGSQHAIPKGTTLVMGDVGGSSTLTAIKGSRRMRLATLEGIPHQRLPPYPESSAAPQFSQSRSTFSFGTVLIALALEKHPV